MDSPPALPVHDASSLADLCDGVLFVVRAGETDHEAAKKASSEFREKNLLGVVLNQVEDSEGQGDDGAPDFEVVEHHGGGEHKHQPLDAEREEARVL